MDFTSILSIFIQNLQTKLEGSKGMKEASLAMVAT